MIKEISRSLSARLVGVFFVTWWFVVRPLMKRVIRASQAKPVPVGEKAGRGKLTHNMRGIVTGKDVLVARGQWVDG